MRNRWSSKNMGVSCIRKKIATWSLKFPFSVVPTFKTFHADVSRRGLCDKLLLIEIPYGDRRVLELSKSYLRKNKLNRENNQLVSVITQLTTFGKFLNFPKVTSHLLTSLLVGN